MGSPLQKQREDIESACMLLDTKIKEMQHQKQVLTNAFNSIDQNKEDILESGSKKNNEKNNF